MSAKRGGARPKKADDVRVLVSSNKKALHDYHIDHTWEAGIVLTGTEVKSVRTGRVSLLDGYCFIENGEIWLDAVHIPEYAQGTWTNHAPRRKRKLLLHKAEILKLTGKTREKGFTIVPLKMYFVGSHVKVEIALARGKKEWDKRQTLREQQDKREALRAMRQREMLS
ncbi:SsrA-binding protein SmpB [Dermabacteraceae bacterium P13095]